MPHHGPPWPDFVAKPVSSSSVVRKARAVCRQANTMLRKEHNVCPDRERCTVVTVVAEIKIEALPMSSVNDPLKSERVSTNRAQVRRGL